MSEDIIGGGRALQVCDLCYGVDDHPRHTFAGGQEGRWASPTAEGIQKVIGAKASPEDTSRLLTELIDTGTTSRHRDCCRAAGCPTGECDRLPDLRGAKLLDWIMERAS